MAKSEMITMSMRELDRLKTVQSVVGENSPFQLACAQRVVHPVLPGCHSLASTESRLT